MYNTLTIFKSVIMLLFLRGYGNLQLADRQLRIFQFDQCLNCFFVGLLVLIINFVERVRHRELGSDGAHLSVSNDVDRFATVVETTHAVKSSFELLGGNINVPNKIVTVVLFLVVI